MTIRFIIESLLPFAAAASLVACGDDKHADTPVGACYDFATLLTSGPSGSEFELQKAEDSPVVRYVAKQTISPDSLCTYNMRMIIMYSRHDGGMPYTSGPITLYGYRLTDNKYQTVQPDTLAARDSHPLKMQSITRTGKYLNMQMQLSCMRTAVPDELSLVMTPGAEITDSVPELRIIYHPKESGENYMTGYASFCLDPLWQKAKGVKISWISPEGKLSHTFLKN